MSYKKLDLILNKLNDLEERIKKIEDKTSDIHKYVPFVGSLEHVAQRLYDLRLLPSYIRNAVVEYNSENERIKN